MKKILLVFLFAIITIIFPFKIAMAFETGDTQKTQLNAEIKYAKQNIKQKTSTIKTLESQIDKRGTQLSNLFKILYDKNMVPSEEKIAQIQSKEMEMAKIIKRVLKIENKVAKIKKDININVRQKEHTLALENLNKQNLLLDMKIELLQNYDLILEQYIDLVKSLQYK